MLVRKIVFRQQVITWSVYYSLLGIDKGYTWSSAL